MPQARGQASDASPYFNRLRQDAEDIANSVDAGLPEASNAALARLTSHLSEAERYAAAQLNGHRAPAAEGPLIKTPPIEALEAEEHVLGAMLIAPAAVKAALTELRPEHFYRDSNRILYEAMVSLESKGTPVDHITVVDYLTKNALLDRIHGVGGTKGPEGKDRVYELAALVPATSNVVHYCKIVRRAALERNLQYAVKMEPRDAEAIAEAAAALTREEVAGDARRALDAADWLANQPEGCPAVWGNNDAVLWAEGEPLMLYGPDGVGKTSLAQQIVLHRCGIRHDVLLGLPVVKADRPVLYLACDRPRQARRSMYRMVPRDQHELLRDRLLIWEGPLPFAIHASPRALLDFCLLHDAGTVVVDSLKDVAVELTKPEIALKINHAFQWLMANGVELLILHHPRKDPAGTPEKPKSLEDVYGDRNFVAGMGSVVLLWGKGGDPIVEVRHLKQPAGEFGPLKVLHDHDAGRTVLYEYATVGEILLQAGRPLSVPEVATRFFGSEAPTKNELEKTRRQLRKLVEENAALEMKDSETGSLAFAAR
jgi:replicative DNA helicase